MTHPNNKAAEHKNPDNNEKLENLSDHVGTIESDKSFVGDELDRDMPKTFVNTSGDSNQIGRSAEEEIENNTDIDRSQENEKESENLDALSDNVNEDADKSIRISGSSEDA